MLATWSGSTRRSFRWSGTITCGLVKASGISWRRARHTVRWVLRRQKRRYRRRGRVCWTTCGRVGKALLRKMMSMLAKRDASVYRERRYEVLRIAREGRQNLKFESLNLTQILRYFAVIQYASRSSIWAARLARQWLAMCILSRRPQVLTTKGHYHSPPHSAVLLMRRILSIPSNIDWVFDVLAAPVSSLRSTIDVTSITSTI